MYNNGDGFLYDFFFMPNRSRSILFLPSAAESHAVEHYGLLRDKYNNILIERTPANLGWIILRNPVDTDAVIVFCGRFQVKVIYTRADERVVQARIRVIVYTSGERPRALAVFRR